MITGNDPVIAFAITAELGITERRAKPITGSQLEKMHEHELRENVRDVSAYARLAPEHKLRIVEALQRNGEIVVMTATRERRTRAERRRYRHSNGIARTDVANGAADMILTDDDFSHADSPDRPAHRLGPGAGARDGAAGSRHHAGAAVRSTDAGGRRRRLDRHRTRSHRDGRRDASGDARSGIAKQSI